MKKALLSSLAAVALLAMSPTASATTFEGNCPRGDTHVTLDVDHRPASEALRQVADGAGLSLVMTIASEPTVTLHVRDVPASDVVRAVLGDGAFAVTCNGSLMTVRSANAAMLTPPVPSAPPVPPAPPSVRDSAAVSDRVTFGENASVAFGERVRDVVSMGGDVDVRGEVLGNVVSMGGDVHAFPTAVVHGNLVTMGGEAVVDNGAQVMGSRLGTGRGASMHSPHRVHISANAFDKTPSPPNTMLRYAILFLFALALLGAVPERFSALQRTLVRAPVRAGGTGLLASIGALVLVVVLAITLIGIPASLALIFVVPLAAYTGFAAVASVIGAGLPFKSLKDKPTAQLAAGTAVLFVVSLIPVIGTLAVIAAVLAGFGAVVLTRFGKSAPGDIDYTPPSGPFRTSAG